jgi:hypothetical protein
MGGKRARRPAMKVSAIAPRRRAPRRADGGNVADEGEQTTQQPTIDFRREIRMVATMDDGRRRNCSKEEGGGTQDYSTLDNYTADDDNNDRGKITQQSNSLREMEWMMMGMSMRAAPWVEAAQECHSFL